MIIFPTLKVAYANVPKVASTSLCHWFYQRLYGNPYQKAARGQEGRFHIQGYFDKGRCPDARGERDPAAARSLEGYYVFAVTRDPVKRFISMYGGRVLERKGLSKRKLAKAPHLRPTPPINLLVREMEAYFRASRTIRHHAEPMVNFLGRDMSVYTGLFDISETDKLIAELNAHIDATGFKTPGGTQPELQRLQTRGMQHGLEVLSPRSFEKLVEFYKADYESIPTVSLERSRKQFEEARADALAQGRPVGGQGGGKGSRVEDGGLDTET